MQSGSCALNNCSLASLQEVETAADMEYAFPMCQRGINLYANVKPTGVACIVKMVVRQDLAQGSLMTPVELTASVVHWPNYVPYIMGSAPVSAVGRGDSAKTPGLTYVFNISL